VGCKYSVKTPVLLSSRCEVQLVFADNTARSNAILAHKFLSVYACMHVGGGVVLGTAQEGVWHHRRLGAGRSARQALL
jgi:hypothetical protein